MIVIVDEASPRQAGNSNTNRLLPHIAQKLALRTCVVRTLMRLLPVACMSPAWFCPTLPRAAWHAILRSVHPLHTLSFAACARATPVLCLQVTPPPCRF